MDNVFTCLYVLSLNDICFTKTIANGTIVTHINVKLLLCIYILLYERKANVLFLQIMVWIMYDYVSWLCHISFTKTSTLSTASWSTRFSGKTRLTPGASWAQAAARTPGPWPTSPPTWCASSPSSTTQSSTSKINRIFSSGKYFSSFCSSYLVYVTIILRSKAPSLDSFSFRLFVAFGCVGSLNRYRSSKLIL